MYVPMYVPKKNIKRINFIVYTSHPYEDFLIEVLIIEFVIKKYIQITIDY